MRRFQLYHELTRLDIERLWSSVQHHVVIVAGICLPILLLLGLKNGHVTELRRALKESPTGTQITLSVGTDGALLTAEIVEEIGENPRVSLVVPQLRRPVLLGSAESPIRATLYTTEVGDPILKSLGVDQEAFSKANAIVLSKSVAERTGVQEGGAVTATLSRSRGNVAETAEVELEVVAVIERSKKSESDSIGWGTVELLTAFEQYAYGYGVPQFGWPAFRVPAQTSYQGFLIFCEPGDFLTERDIKKLKSRGFETSLIEDEEVRTLYGALDSSKLEGYAVFSVMMSTEAARSKNGYLPAEIVEITDPKDDLAIFWNPTVVAELDGRPFRLVGVSLAKWSWLKDSFVDRENWFGYSDSFDRIVSSSFDGDLDITKLQYKSLLLPLQVKRVVKEEADESDSTLSDSLSPKSEVQDTDRAGVADSEFAALTEESVPVDASGGEPALPVAIVPSALISYLRDYDDSKDKHRLYLHQRLSKTPVPFVIRPLK
ncbi:MAG: hypothetical protein AAF483_02235, partial [Planctomycetota bacterium]